MNLLKTIIELAKAHEERTGHVSNIRCGLTKAQSSCATCPSIVTVVK